MDTYRLMGTIKDCGTTTQLPCTSIPDLGHRLLDIVFERLPAQVFVGAQALSLGDSTPAVKEDLPDVRIGTEPQVNPVVQQYDQKFSSPPRNAVGVARKTFFPSVTITARGILFVLWSRSPGQATGTTGSERFFPQK